MGDPLRNMGEELSNSHATKRNKKAPAEQLAEIEEHRKRVKQKVDEGRQEDTQREKERIKTKHLEEKKYGKRARDDEYDMAMEAPSLSNYDEKGSDDDDSSDSDSDSDSDSNGGSSNTSEEQGEIEDDVDQNDLEKHEALALQLLGQK